MSNEIIEMYPTNESLTSFGVKTKENDDEELFRLVEIEKQKKQKKYKRAHPKKIERDWTAYNLAETQLDRLSLKLAYNVIKELNIVRIRKATGRPSNDMRDMLLCMFIKIHHRKSSRKAISSYHYAKQVGYLKEIPGWNTVSEYMRMPELTKHIISLIEKIAIIIAPLEEHLSIDGSGIGGPHKERWLKVKTEFKKHKDYKKLSIISGAKTHIVAAVSVVEGTTHDNTQFEPLLKQAMKNFEGIKEFSADPGYLSRKNATLIAEYGAKPYIKAKKNSLKKPKGSKAWREMIIMFHENLEEFQKGYGLRNNVEATFSSIKRSYGKNVNSKSQQGQINEIYLKIVCHNFKVLVQSIFLLNIDVRKWLKDD